MTSVAAVTSVALITLQLGFSVMHGDRMNNTHPSNFTQALD